MSPNSNLTTGTTPAGTVKGDFNGDGLMDLAIANSGSTGTAGISIYTNNGSGLPTASSYTLNTGNAPVTPITGDFNGDGKLDLAVTNYTGGTFSVYINAAGTLPSTATQTISSAGTSPWGIATGDFNNDGKLDLAVSNQGSLNIKTFNNNGSGTTPFPTSPTSTLSAGTSPTGLVVADFNGDGKSDLAVANNASNTLGVYINTGSALPTAAPSGANLLTTGLNPVAPVTGDFNGDGKPDLAVTNNNTAASSVSVYINGTWNLPTTATSTLTAGVNPVMATVSDFNGDGKPDLAVANQGSGSAFVYINTGASLPILPTSTLTTGSLPWGVTGDDFNNDGRTDLIVTNGSSNNASVFINQNALSTGTTTINQANGTVGAKINLAPGTTQDAFNIVDSSGKTLVAFDSQGRGTLGSPSIGTGSFTGGYNITTGTQPFDVVAGDFTGDGAPELLVANSLSTNVSVFCNTGSGIPTTACGGLNTAVGVTPYGLVTGDFNGDGRLDVAVANNASTGTAGIYVYINTGGGLSSTATYTINTGNGPLMMVAKDFNGDGKTDLATTNITSTTISVHLNSGTALPATASQTLNTVAAGNPDGIVAADFNNDGRTDLAISNSAAAGTNGVQVYNNNGSATTPFPTSASSNLNTGANNPYFLTTGDFNGDKLPDVVVGNSTTTNAAVFINTGSGLPTSATYTINTASGPYRSVAADFNGDGKTDLAMQNFAGQQVGIYINTGTALPTNPTLVMGTSNTGYFLTAGDFNMDGKQDLAVSNSTNNTGTIWLNSGFGTSRLAIGATNSTETALTLQGAAGQAASLLQLQNAGGYTVMEAKVPTSVQRGYNGAGAVLYVAADASTGRSINASGLVSASGNDFAEYIPWSGEKPSPGSIVKYRGSNYVVSSTATAAFVGNDKFSEQTGLLVAFAGQVPVRVTGAVSEGDLLVPNGDGTAKAVSPAAATVSDALNKVAVAQESNSDSGVKLVDAAVGTTADLPGALQNASATFSDLTVTGTAEFADINVGGSANVNDLVVTGTATISVLHVTSSAVFDTDITVGGHIITAGGEPTTEVQTATGTGADIVVDGTDATGTITITTGSNPAAGGLAKILFSRTYGQAPHIVLSPSNDKAAGLQFFKGNTSATDFMFNALDSPQPNTTYKFDYFIAQ